MSKPPKKVKPPEPSPQHYTPDSLVLFVFPALQFANSISATRSAADLMRSHALSARQVEADFVAEAEHMCPEYSKEAHETAARLIHRSVHRFQDAREALHKKTDALIDKVYHASFDHLRPRLEEVTGDPEAEHRYQHVWGRINSRPSTERLLGGALLTQAVSEFEVLVSRLVRSVLVANPNVLLASDQTYSLRDLQKYTTVEDVRKALAEDVADRLLRKGFAAWMAWFSSQLKQDIPGVLSSAGELTEVFQRRHLMVHNGGVVNEAYLSNLGSVPAPESGTRLTVTREYLLRGIDMLEAAGVTLAAAAALKFSVDQPSRTAAEEALDHACFEALQRGHATVARDVSAWLIPVVEDEPSRTRLQVNHWLSRKIIDGRNSVEAEVRSWDTRALSDQYKLARLALLDDVEDAYALVVKMTEAKTLSLTEFQTWPVLAPVREYAQDNGHVLAPRETWDTSHAH